MKSQNPGCPISRVFCEKWVPTTPTTLEPIHRFVLRARSHVCQKKANMERPSLKVSAPLPRGNKIPVPSLRRTQRQDGSQQVSHVRIRNPICPRMLANSFCRDSESADSSDKGIFEASAPCIPYAARRRKAGGCAGQSGSRRNIDVIRIVCGRAGGKSEWMRSSTYACHDGSISQKSPFHQLAAPPAPFNPLFPHVLPVTHVCDTAD